MDIDPLSPLALAYVAFRFAYVLCGLIGLLWLWRRPRPLPALLLLVGLNLATWAASVAPLGRLYGLSEHLDRGFVVGMTATVATGHSPFEHTQVGFANLEPLWSALPAALALFRPENAIAVWFWLSPLALVVVGLGLYFGLRVSDLEDDAWERLLIVFAVLGLSSFSLSQRAPLPPFWSASFLLKPNHAAGWAMLASSSVCVRGSAGRSQSGSRWARSPGCSSCTGPMPWQGCSPACCYDPAAAPRRGRWRSPSASRSCSPLPTSGT